MQTAKTCGTFLTITNHSSRATSRMPSRAASSIATPAKRQQKSKGSYKKKDARTAPAPPGTVTIGYRPLPLSLRNRVKLSRSQTVTTAAGIGTFAIGCNNILAPVSAAVSVGYFETLTDLYENWRVIRSKVTVTPRGGNNDKLIYSLYIHDDKTVSYLDYNKAVESGAGVQRTFQDPKGNTLTKSWSASGNLGNRALTTNAWGGKTFGPTEEQFFVLTLGGANAADGADFQINVEYDVEWTELLPEASKNN